jgi:hypothetical protein
MSHVPYLLVHDHISAIYRQETRYVSWRHFCHHHHLTCSWRRWPNTATCCGHRLNYFRVMLDDKNHELQGSVKLVHTMFWILHNICTLCTAIYTISWETTALNVIELLHLKCFLNVLLMYTFLSSYFVRLFFIIYMYYVWHAHLLAAMNLLK